ncbi:hypothetical protein TI39_contig375g00007 [Zymoseptoria brevis]|uniref:Uncharacterized protein n=1 Tax=Zymoseptoria brevis TaxID=1047168 RepID=A0A0F4GPT9_9PEZI|nr:hypothetical protein TI39_contig375g00007 [Zymoseptoria brevis]
MATAPRLTRKRESPPVDSALDTLPSKRRTPRTTASPWKNPLRQNSDFSSPIFNRSLGFDRNDSDVNMAGYHIEDIEYDGTLDQHVRAQNQFQNELQAAAAATPNPYSAPHPMLAVPAPTLNFDDFLNSGEHIHTANAQDYAQAQNTHQHHTQGTTAAESDIESAMRRRLFPVISRKEVWGLDRMGEHDGELMAGADDGGRGLPPTRTQVAVRSPSLARSDMMGSDGEEEVFVDAEEEITGTDGGDNDTAEAGEKSDSGSESADEEEKSGSETDEEDERYMLDDDHRDENAQMDLYDDMAEDQGLRRGEYAYIRGRRGIITGIRQLLPDEKDSDDSGSDDSDSGESKHNNLESDDSDDDDDGNGEAAQEGSAAGQDSQDPGQGGENGEDGEQGGEAGPSANANGRSDKGSGGEEDQKEDEPSDFETLEEEDENVQAASQATAGDSQNSNANIASQDQHQQVVPQTTIIDLLSDDEEEPSQSLEMLDDGGTKHADSLFSKAFKNTPKIKKSKAHVTDSSASSTASEQALSAFSGGPSSRIKSLPGPHRTRISHSSSPPPPTNTTTPTSRPPRPRPDTRRDLSRHLNFHSKFHNAALHLIPRLPSYESFAWTRRYWIAVLLPKKNLYKPHFSEKDFVWFKGNKFTTVETVWNYFQTTTMSDPDDLALLVGGVEGVGFKDQMRELDYFGDKFVVFQALGREQAEDVEGRSLVEGVVPKGVVEVVELVDDDDEE